MINHYTLLLLAVCPTFTFAQKASVVTHPQSMNVSLHGFAMFNCTVIGSVLWAIDGALINSDLRNKGFDDSAPELTLNLTQELRSTLLRVLGSPNSNNVSITCLATIQITRFTNDVDKSESALMLVQGLLESVSDLTVTLINVTTVRISWSPPFTLEGVPILGYNVTITSTISGENKPMLVKDTTLLYSIDHPDPENNFTVTVVSTNDVGAGGLTEIRFKILPVTPTSVGNSIAMTTLETSYTISTISVTETPPSTGPSDVKTDNLLQRIAVAAAASPVVTFLIVVIVGIVVIVVIGLCLRHYSSGELTALPKQQMEPESEKREPHQGADADAVANAVAVADPEADADADASSEVENSLPVHVNVHEAENERESDAVQSSETQYADTEENEESAPPSGTNPISYATSPGVAHEPMYDNTRPGAREHVFDDPLNEPPKRRDLLKRVASRAKDKWRVLGLELNIPYHQLQSIERDERYPDLCFAKVFAIWESKSDPPFTWATIVKALRSPRVEENRLAMEIEDWLKRHR